MTAIQTPGTDTPGIYDFDLQDLTWAAEFCDVTGMDQVRAMLGQSADDYTGHEYAALTGLARVHVRGLLMVLNRLAAKVTEQDQQLAAIREAAARPVPAPRRVCCDSREGAAHEIECGRPLFHWNRDQLADAIATGDQQAQAEWDMRNGETAARIAGGAG